MTAASALPKSEALQQMAKAVERNVCIGSAKEDSFQEFCVLAHGSVWAGLNIVKYRASFS